MLDHRQLNTIKVASPCHESWAGMTGDAQVRHCASCDQDVYNLSEMSLDEISRLLARKEGRTCVRFFRRADGTVLTADCPVGLARVRRKLALVAAAVGAVLSSGVAGFTVARGALGRTLRDSRLAQIGAVKALADWMEPVPHRDPVVMGMLMAPPTPHGVRMGRIALPRTSCQPTEIKGEMVMGDYIAPAPKRK